MKKKILIVIGTRPELIKLAPVIIELKKKFKRPSIIILNTAQHKELLNPYWKIFNIKADYQLNFMKPGQSLSELTYRGIQQFDNFIESLYKKGESLNGIIAQGDTTTVMVSSIVAFYKNIPFFHIEAGLRTFDLQNPFPEEFNRKVAAISAKIHFAPTLVSKNNLYNEGIKKNVIVTGNTIVDSVELFKKNFKNYKLNNKTLSGIIEKKSQKKLILITCHRRENHGENLKNIIEAVCDLAEMYNDYFFIWPLHPNPNVLNVVKNSKIDDHKNIIKTEPLDYLDLLYVLSKSKLVLTDSGGIQEEAPSFNVPVLILRNKTERPEGVNSGIAILVGTDKFKIIKKAKEILSKDNFIFKNPYGDGKASKKIVRALIKYLSIK
ncbi:MAG: non-hydrolyzing UDP-N-acetylglucosamine 2-epimerase [Bacteroidia bacterium]